mmetsp:Transcript_30753/g.95148  ORF Transcript_30753/g.95148 Transcript_30753/m.95148 type:complete len:172 (-) Transcript_30753:566-1081(-)
MRCKPKPVSDIMVSPADVPQGYIGCAPYIPKAGTLAHRLFGSWHLPTVEGGRNLPPNDYAMASVLLAWIFDKRSADSVDFGARGTPFRLYNLRDPALQFLYVAFRRILPFCSQFSVSRPGVDVPLSDVQLSIGYGEMVFRVRAMAPPATVEIEDALIVQLLNGVSPAVAMS